MRISITLRIWITVAIIVLIFTILVMYIVPSQQEKYFYKTFNQEIENLAKTVALGTDIALIENNFEGIQVAMDFAKTDSRLAFVGLIEDTSKNASKTGKRMELTYPPNYNFMSAVKDSPQIFIKRALFKSASMNGEILVGFRTDEIRSNMRRVRYSAIIVSIIVLIFGILLGLWLAKTISNPVKAIRDAALKVGEGDLTQHLMNHRQDEIGDLSRAFNKMVTELSLAEDKIREKNNTLMHTLEDLELKNDLLTKEKQKSDTLLLNILPEETATELKQFGHCKPQSFKEVSVLFTDFVQFTKIGETMSPEALVKEIDYCFSQFDTIIVNNGLEKIKTIGDSYMCAGGLPKVTKDHAEKCIIAGLEIQHFLKEYKTQKIANNAPFFEARIGINSGPIVAGVVGSKKFAYDIWGDTANTASRMESSGVADKVNISQTTYELVKEDPRFIFEYRGKVQAKSKGEVDMYFVDFA